MSQHDEKKVDQPESKPTEHKEKIPTGEAGGGWEFPEDVPDGIMHQMWRKKS